MQRDTTSVALAPVSRGMATVSIMAPALTRTAIARIGEWRTLDKIGGPLGQAVHRATKPNAVKNALSGGWLGHQLHPMLTDVPIGAWLMASAVDYTVGKPGSVAARRLVALGVLGAVPTAAAGASDWSDSYGGDQRVGLVHGIANVAATGLHAWSWVARRQGRHRTGVALSTLGLGLTAAASYLGGHLSFGRGVGVNNTSFQPPVTDWVDVAKLSALDERTPIRVTAGTVPAVLVKVDGRVHALSATCTHASGPLDEGKIIDDEHHGACIVCPWHGSQFSVIDGNVARGPASVPQPRWQVRIDNDDVSIKMVDPVPDH